jgi:hypothetical protein
MVEKTRNGKKPHELANALAPEKQNGDTLIRPMLRLANPLDEPIVKKDDKIALCKKEVSCDQKNLDKMLLKAMQGTILETEVRKAALFLESPVPLLKLLAIVTLSDVKWKNVSKETCELVFDALKKAEKDPDKSICRSAHKVMENILDATLMRKEGDEYGKKAA